VHVLNWCHLALRVLAYAYTRSDLRIRKGQHYPAIAERQRAHLISGIDHIVPNIRLLANSGFCVFYPFSIFFLMFLRLRCVLPSSMLWLLLFSAAPAIVAIRQAGALGSDRAE